MMTGRYKYAWNRFIPETENLLIGFLVCLFALLPFFLLFWDKVLKTVCVSDWPWIHSYSPASPSHMLGLQVCTIIPSADLLTDRWEYAPLISRPSSLLCSVSLGEKSVNSRVLTSVSSLWGGPDSPCWSNRSIANSHFVLLRGSWVDSKVHFRILHLRFPLLDLRVLRS